MRGKLTFAHTGVYTECFYIPILIKIGIHAASSSITGEKFSITVVSPKPRQLTIWIPGIVDNEIRILNRSFVIDFIFSVQQ